MGIIRHPYPIGRWNPLEERDEAPHALIISLRRIPGIGKLTEPDPATTDTKLHRPFPATGTPHYSPIFRFPMPEGLSLRHFMTLATFSCAGLTNPLLASTTDIATIERVAVDTLDLSCTTSNDTDAP
jgi:hypothetical protein